MKPFDWFGGQTKVSWVQMSAPSNEPSRIRCLEGNISPRFQLRFPPAPPLHVHDVRIHISECLLGWLFPTFTQLCFSCCQLPCSFAAGGRSALSSPAAAVSTFSASILSLLRAFRKKTGKNKYVNRFNNKVSESDVLEENLFFTSASAKIKIDNIQRHNMFDINLTSMLGQTCKSYFYFILRQLRWRKLTWIPGARKGGGDAVRRKQKEATCKTILRASLIIRNNNKNTEKPEAQTNKYNPQKHKGTSAGAHRK